MFATLIVKSLSRQHEFDIPIVVLQLIRWIFKSAVKKDGYKEMKRQYSGGVKIGIGVLAINTCCAAASSVESKRLKAPIEERLLDDPETEFSISSSWVAFVNLFLGFNGRTSW
ncbi:hypothetical protein V6N13_035768 [Hibiscus sabdariffa]|uniref:Uncharacterized protein n=1 Tax=Hibiscus sabdariffa TaxID=183260 RepID=A0ABR2S8G9_9ROSI